MEKAESICRAEHKSRIKTTQWHIDKVNRKAKGRSASARILFTFHEICIRGCSSRCNLICDILSPMMSSTCWKRATKHSNGNAAVGELDRLIASAVEIFIFHREELTQFPTIKVFYFPIRWKLSQTHIQSWTRSCVVFTRRRQRQVLEPSKSFKFRIWVWMARSRLKFRAANSHCIAQVASTASRFGISMSRHALQTRERFSVGASPLVWQAHVWQL